MNEKESKQLETNPPVLVLVEPFKCKFGLHVWSVWSEAQVSAIGALLDQKHQWRHCRKCNFIRTRLIR